MECRQNSELSHRGLAWGSTGRLIERQPGLDQEGLSVEWNALTSVQQAGDIIR